VDIEDFLSFLLAFTWDENPNPGDGIDPEGGMQQADTDGQ
jgi:hypothetical protein